MKKSDVKTSAYVLLLMISLIAIFAGIAFACSEISTLKVANLELANDASTPEQKAVFLRKFIADTDSAKLPEHAAWLWKSERNKISNQRIVLESLIKRCDDLSGMDKQSFGYAQGMTQVSGDEFSHAISEIMAIYVKGYLMTWGWAFGNLWWVFLAIFILPILGITSAILNAH